MTSTAIQESQSTAPIGTAETRTRFSDRALEIHRAIASRAYQLFESRGQIEGHDLEDWLLAESEILRPIMFNIYEFEDELVTRAQVPVLTSDEIAVLIEERRIIISDRSPLIAESTDASEPTKTIYQIVSLPEPVDWANALVNFKDGLLEITTPKLLSNGVATL